MWAAIMTVGGTLTFLAPLAVGALTDLTGSYLPRLLPLRRPGLEPGRGGLSAPRAARTSPRPPHPTGPPAGPAPRRTAMTTTGPALDARPRAGYGTQGWTPSSPATPGGALAPHQAASPERPRRSVARAECRRRLHATLAGRTSADHRHGPARQPLSLRHSGDWSCCSRLPLASASSSSVPSPPTSSTTTTSATARRACSPASPSWRPRWPSPAACWWAASRSRTLVAGGWLLCGGPGPHPSRLRLPRARRHADHVWRLHRHPPSRPGPAAHVLVPPPRAAPGERAQPGLPSPWPWPSPPLSRPPCPMSIAIGWKAALSVFGLVNLAGALTWIALGRVGQQRQGPHPRPLPGPCVEGDEVPSGAPPRRRRRRARGPVHRAGRMAARLLL